MRDIIFHKYPSVDDVFKVFFETEGKKWRVGTVIKKDGTWRFTYCNRLSDACFEADKYNTREDCARRMCRGFVSKRRNIKRREANAKMGVENNQWGPVYGGRYD
jgi:deoxyhypusine synthase